MITGICMFGLFPHVWDMKYPREPGMEKLSPFPISTRQNRHGAAFTAFWNVSLLKMFFANVWHGPHPFDEYSATTGM
jgi:hypothetical protein